MNQLTLTLGFSGLGLLILLAVLAAAEYSLIRVRRAALEALAAKGNNRAQTALILAGHLSQTLRQIRTGFILAVLLLSAVGCGFLRGTVVGPLLARMEPTAGTPLLLAETGLALALVWAFAAVFGYLIPRLIAADAPVATALMVAYPIRWINLLLEPFGWLFSGTAAVLMYPFGVGRRRSTSEDARGDEIRMVFSEAHGEGDLGSDRRDLLENVFDFTNRIVRQIMVPRTEVAFFDLRKSLGENLGVAHRTAHSRYPLVDGDLDHVVGVIHMKDLFWQLKDMELYSEPGDTAPNPADRNPLIAGGDLSAALPATGAQFLKSIVREALFVPETMAVHSLLKEFQQKRIHLAMVIDEYGGTAGMVTFENVIEEIIGDVQDEFDAEAPNILQTGEREYSLDGITTLLEVNEALGTHFDAGEVDTIGGLVTSELGRLPRTGERFDVADITFTVTSMRGQRIQRVTVVLPEEEKVPQPADARDSPADR